MILSYTSTQLLLKFSLLFQYKRIFQTPQSRKPFTGLLVILCAYALFAEFSTIFTCWPIAKYWNDDIPGGCIDRAILHYVIAGINIAIDLTLLIIPILHLKKLHITPRAKWVLIACFACGGVACIVAIIRLQALHANISATTDEQPSMSVNIAIWSHLELNIAITCASVPAIKPIFVKTIPKLSPSQSSQRRDINPSSGNKSRAGVMHSQTIKQNTVVSTNELEERDMGIKVDDRIELETIYIADNSSEKNLVTVSWTADCYTATPNIQAATRQARE
ncbi:hypothetical protein TruAng_001273 [Truncatella angustata]|nr:hypothetical protein TruAng_001273 [Truncatella angustata]